MIELLKNFRSFWEPEVKGHFIKGYGKQNKKTPSDHVTFLTRKNPGSYFISKLAQGGGRTEPLEENWIPKLFSSIQNVKCSSFMGYGIFRRLG